MLNFKNDYCTIAHPKILESLDKYSNMDFVGYGLDEVSLEAANIIKNEIKKPESDVHFLVGGTMTNKALIHHALKSYEAVICCDSGHINVHETGAIEQTSHKVITCPHHDGKIKANDIEKIVISHTDEHMVKPKMVYISNSTEYGTIYSKSELTEISQMCKKLNLYLYLDGARLAVSLTCKDNDLTISEIADLVDAFYIGGAKNGLMLGEALVINNPKLKEEFRYTLKQLGGMYSKGFINGIQFKTLFIDGLFYEIGSYQNKLAYRLQEGLKALGINFELKSQTNQIFPIFENYVVDKLKETVRFEYWNVGKTHSTIRFVTHFKLSENDIESLLEQIKVIINS